MGFAMGVGREGVSERRGSRLPGRGFAFPIPLTHYVWHTPHLSDPGASCEVAEPPD